MATRTRPPTTRRPLPADVRLMNATALGARHRRRRAGRRDARAVARRASRCSRSARSRVEGDVARNSVLDDPRQRGAAARRQLLHARSRRSAARVRVGAVGAPRGRPARLARTGCASSSKSTGRRRSGAATSGHEKLVNSFGEVFEANLGDVEDDALPTLSGPERQRGARCWRCSRRVDAGLAPLGARIDSLACSGRGSWQATLDSGAVVELGRGSDDDVLARTGALRRDARPGDVALTSGRSSTPTCATPTATRCGCRACRRRATRPTSRRRRRREDRWPRNSRTSSSGSTSAPPR